MNEILFYISVSSALILMVLVILPLVFTKFEFFPPPAKESWQYRVFWILFRSMFVSLVILSFTNFNPAPFISNTVRYLITLPLLLAGFGLASYLSYCLGWRNAHGEAEGLVKSGVYRWSRNPIYVTSIIGMLGWGMFVNSGYVSVVLVFWAAMYIVAPFIEEKWLEKIYGNKFLSYKNSAARFIGIPKKT